jgi:hypothetical protein
MTRIVFHDRERDAALQREVDLDQALALARAIVTLRFRHALARQRTREQLLAALFAVDIAIRRLEMRKQYVATLATTGAFAFSL